MSDFFSVVVSAVNGVDVDLEVTIIHPDIAKVSTTATFALSLLVDPLRESPWCDEPGVLGSPLAKRLGTDSRPSDEDVDALARGFITSSQITEQRHYPPPDSWDQADAWRAFWAGDERPVVNLRVSVSHPGWCAHLRAGMRWASAAYSVGEGVPWVGAGLTPE